MTENIEIIVEPSLPDISVTVEPPLPEAEVVVSEIGLPGAPGAPGVPGPPGPPGENGVGDAAAVASHIDDPTPHPVYDDGPSFLLLYQNAKV